MNNQSLLSQCQQASLFNFFGKNYWDHCVNNNFWEVKSSLMKKKEYNAQSKRKKLGWSSETWVLFVLVIVSLLQVIKNEN